MTKIFYGDEEEWDFSHPDKYAFLNWCMDDGMGTQQRPAKVQKVFDNYYIGRAYLGNALKGVRNSKIGSITLEEMFV